MTSNDCNCGAQDKAEHDPHKRDCAVYDPPEITEEIVQAE